MKKATANLLQVCVASFSFICTNKSIAIAQVTPDNTVNTQVNQNGNVAEITGGEARGANLFHSFQDFSVPTGNEAFFDNATDISNIFSRVTGGNVSNISGLIRANDANLFLINPAGILFGAGARLDLGGGSFYGSTADSILFEDGEFSAVDNLSEPILTINAPIGLGFRDNPADITVRGDGNGARLEDSEPVDTQEALRVSGDATIGIVGGNLIFEDATIKTAGGRIEIGSVGGGRVDLVEVANGFTFNYSGIEAFGDISLSGRSNIDASGNGGGDINVAGRNISLTGVSAFVSNTLGDETGGDINVFATDAIEISGVENELDFISAIVSRTFPNGTADAGDINIETGSLSLGDRAGILTVSSGQANSGNITINTSDSVSLEGQGDLTQIASSIAADAVGNAGNIVINSGSLNLNNGALLFANNSGQGNAGNITISTNDLTFVSNPDGRSSISTAVGSDGIGDAGDININTSNFTIQGTENPVVIISGNLNENQNQNSGNINITTKSLVSSNGLLSNTNSGQGLSGNISIDAIEDISLNNNSSIFVQGIPGGSINLNAKNLFISSGSSLLAGISSTNNSNLTAIQSGDIVINLSEDLVIDGIGSNNRLTAIDNSNLSQGNAGNIELSARNINLINGGRITSNNDGSGNIGNITINASEDITIDGFTNVGDVRANSIISTFVAQNAIGDVGEINITAKNLNLNNSGQIQSSVAGIANSGDINLNISDTIIVDGFANVTNNFFGEEITQSLSSGISTNVSSGTGEGEGNSGNINIDTENLFLSRSGNISTSNLGQGDAGNININADLITLGEQGNTFLASLSSIRSNATDLLGENSTTVGNAGNILINTRSLSINDGSDISVDTSATGNGGNITINATDSISVSGSGTLVSIEFDNEGLIIPGSTNREVEISSNISSSVLSDAVGDGGNIEINTPQLSISNEAEIISFARGQGDAGSIIINSPQLSIIDGLINTDTQGEGNAGNLIINADQFVRLSGNSFVRAGTLSGSIGDGGNLTINTGQLSVSDGAQVSTATSGQGNAGNLIVNADESIELSGFDDDGRSGLFAGALNEDGNGGDLQIFTQDLIIRDGATINVSNFPSVEGLTEPGTGEAGSLTIEADSLSIENGGRINAATQAGNGGNITLNIADNITLKETGFISARALKDANGGNINIDTNFIVAFPNGNNDIIANAEQGNGGNITINAESLLGIQAGELNPFTNDIDASSEFSLDGNVTIDTPDTNSFQGETDLPQNIIQTEQTTAQACETNREVVAQNTLTISGKGGVPPAPESPLSSQNISINGKHANSTVTNPNAIATSQGEIIPARGIKVTEDGKIVLTSYRTDNSGERIPAIKNNCGV